MGSGKAQGRPSVTRYGTEYALGAHAGLCMLHAEVTFNDHAGMCSCCLQNVTCSCFYKKTYSHERAVSCSPLNRRLVWIFAPGPGQDRTSPVGHPARPVPVPAAVWPACPCWPACQPKLTSCCSCPSEDIGQCRAEVLRVIRRLQEAKSVRLSSPLWVKLFKFGLSF